MQTEQATPLNFSSVVVYLNEMLFNRLIWKIDIDDMRFFYRYIVVLLADSVKGLTF